MNDVIGCQRRFVQRWRLGLDPFGRDSRELHDRPLPFAFPECSGRFVRHRDGDGWHFRSPPPWRKYAASAGVSVRTVAVNSVPSLFLSARTVSLHQHRDDAEQFGALRGPVP
jgi:hypothetical protein